MLTLVWNDFDMLQKYEHVLNSQSRSYLCYILDSKICYQHAEMQKLKEIGVLSTA